MRNGLVELPDGIKEWYLNGLLHREDGPAVEMADGSKWWYLNGKLHRIDGPAIEYPDGLQLWYLNGVVYTEIEHQFWSKLLTNIPKHDQVIVENII